MSSAPELLAIFVLRMMFRNWNLYEALVNTWIPGSENLPVKMNEV